jgi:hypothetical protein
MYIQRKRGRRIVADAEVAPEAMDLLFEAEDVAELVAEVTGDVVEVTADGDEVVFSVGEGEIDCWDCVIDFDEFGENFFGKLHL